MIKKIAAIIFLFLVVILSYSQEVILKGRVSSEDGVPLPGAHVKLLSTGVVTISNAQGRFTLQVNLQGNDTLLVSYVGYSRQLMPVTASSQGTEMLFVLQEAKYLAEEAVVTATGNKVARKDVSPAISIVPRKTLEESEESALLPVISEEVPGVFVTERGMTGFGVASGSAGQISIRGVGGNPNTGVLVLIDGSPQYMGLFGHPLPDAYVTTDAEKVEVIRGPASMMYGSNAMAGVINIISREQRENGLGGRARLSYGSFNTWKASANAGYKNKGFTAFMSINHDQTKGHRENSPFDITNAYLKAGTDLGENFRITADGSIAVFHSIDPGPVNTADSSYLLEDHWIDIQRNMISLSIENNHALLEGALKMFYNSGRHEIYDGFRSTDFNYGFAIYESLSLFKGTRLSGGFDFKNYGGKAENVEAMMGQGIVFADTSLFELGGYLMVTQDIADRWVLTAGLRLNHQSTSGEEWVPQFGVNYLLNANNILKASASKGFRYPTIRELYMWQPANPGLLPESMWCYEGSYLGRFPAAKLDLEVTAYYQEGSNLIQTIGQYPNIKYENTGEFIHYGIEVAGRWQPWEAIAVETNYSWLHMDKAVTASPGHQLFTALNFRKSKFAARLSGMYIHGLYTSITPESVEDYFLLNARVSYTILEMLTLWISGKNLLDREYEINYAYPMPGIALIGGIDLNFNTRAK